MNKPCPNTVSCSCSPNPITNFSSEGPDRIRYLGLSWRTVTPVIGNRGTTVIPNPPPHFCISFDSQLNAQICADNAAVLDNIKTGGPFFNFQQSCTSMCPDGTLFTYIVGMSTIARASQYEADQAAYSLACQLAYQRKICLGTFSSLQTCAGTFFAATLSVDASVAVTAATVIAGGLPPGISLSVLNPNTLALVGSTSTPGLYPFTVRAITSLGNYMDKPFTLDVLGITTTSPLPDAPKDSFYAEQLAAAGGTEPYSYSLAPGSSLPAGLSLSSDGRIDGTPTMAGDYSFTVLIVDSSP